MIPSWTGIRALISAEVPEMHVSFPLIRNLLQSTHSSIHINAEFCGSVQPTTLRGTNSVLR